MSPIFVKVNQKIRVDFDLEVNSVHETATMTAHASPVQTKEASEGCSHCHPNSIQHLVPTVAVRVGDFSGGF